MSVVNGPLSSTLNNIATWNDNVGVNIKNTRVSISDLGNVVTPGGLELGVVRNTIQTSDTYGYVDNIGVGVIPSTQLSSYSLLCSSSVIASTLYAHSSRNIKNILNSGKEVEQEALELFEKIPFKKYEYKDKIKHGKKIVYGMIAEELKEILPDTVKENKSFLPNIMQYATFQQHLNNTRDIYLIKITLGSALNSSIKRGDRVQLIDEEGEKEGIIDEVLSNNLTITSNVSFKGKLFIYGTYGDCPTISKDDVFEMGMVVLQSLVKQLKEKAII